MFNCKLFLFGVHVFIVACTYRCVFCVLVCVRVLSLLY